MSRDFESIVNANSGFLQHASRVAQHILQQDAAPHSCFIRKTIDQSVAKRHPGYVSRLRLAAVHRRRDWVKYTIRY